MTPAERETILRTDDASDAWTVWSAKGSRQARRLLKRCTPARADATGYWFTIPLTWVRVVPSHRRALDRRQTTVMSDDMLRISGRGVSSPAGGDPRAEHPPS